ncbi:hypothetical protein STAS_10382 [Striga asiatica]|uniref:Uncharacterized protein n=1 Tax=Striga asiatica TaxID=4170 RepID=A0A5A7PMQ5_STRAF|nr:hypothetical protein STAS_10382 [Striga asiatica]
MKKKNTNGPLQDINGRLLPNIHNLSTKRPSNFASFSSSSSASVPYEAPKTKCCSIKHSLSSETSISSSSSRTYFQKMPNTDISRIANAPKLLSKSKPKEILRKPFSHMNKRDPPQSYNQRNIAKPICKNGQRSKLAPAPSQIANKFKKGPSKLFRSKLKKNPQDKGPTSGNLISNPNSDQNCSPLGKFDLDPVNFETEIVDFSSHKVDKENISCCTAVKTPPVEASLSPEIQSQSRSKIPILNSESTTPVFYGAGHLISGVTDRRKCRRRGSLKGGFEKANLFHEDGDSIEVSRNSPIPVIAEASVRWVLSPCDEENEDFNHVSAEKASDLICPNIGDYSALSISSFSDRNIIRTPDSDMWSEEDVRLFQSKIGIVTESLNKVDKWDSTVFQDNADNNVSSSWVSSTALDNLSLSQMIISWRDEKVSKNDEFDCCCLLSDEEADGSCGERRLESYEGTEGGGEKESRDNKDNEFELENGFCPVLLDYEPQICGRGKENLLSNEANACAQSTFTNEGALAASSDSDWTFCRESHLFQVGNHRI